MLAHLEPQWAASLVQFTWTLHRLNKVTFSTCKCRSLYPLYSCFALNPTMHWEGNRSQHVGGLWRRAPMFEITSLKCPLGCLYGRLIMIKCPHFPLTRSTSRLSALPLFSDILISRYLDLASAVNKKLILQNWKIKEALSLQNWKIFTEIWVGCRQEEVKIWCSVYEALLIKWDGN